MFYSLSLLLRLPYIVLLSLSLFLSPSLTAIMKQRCNIFVPTTSQSDKTIRLALQQFL